jgi:hypothetical protein
MHGANMKIKKRFWILSLTVAKDIISQNQDENSQEV